MTSDRPRRLLLPGVILLAAACAPEQHSLTLGRSSEEPAPAIADSVRDTLNTQGIILDLQFASDPAAAMRAVLDGDLDLAIVEEPDHPLPQIMTLSPLYPSVLHVLHRQPAVAGDFVALIDGTSVYAGPIGGTAHQLLLDLAEDFGLSADNIEVLDNPWTVSPDVYFILGGLLSQENVNFLEDYRLFNFASPNDIDGGSVADAVALRHHHLRPFLLPKGVYPGIAETAVVTLSTRTVLIAHEGFDEQLAFDIASALFTNAQEISKSYPLVTGELQEDLDATELMLPLHPGTRRFRDRDRPGFVERNVDVIALYLTIGLAAFSGVFALYRNRLQVRKDRIDVFYQRLIDIRETMKTAADSGSQIQKQQVLNVQREVLDLLIEERIAADASLVAFVILSNQMLDEIDRATSGTNQSL
ncbi:MAG: hypothetical protein K0U72_12460 [Gammaproteobacteria bacterium]|nr:hypothetical protein [Gammaproteobacteria bacterium]